MYHLITKKQFGLTLAILSVVFTSYGAEHTKGREVEPFARALKPGDYVWHPEVSPAGPVVVLVSIPDQIIYVYRNGVRVGRSTYSTGKPSKTHAHRRLHRVAKEGR